MSGAAHSLLEITARLLPAQQREAVLGDLAEAEESAGRSMFAIAGLIARQELEPWRTWRPWLAGALGLPGSLLLLGASFSLSMSLRPVLRGDFTRLMPHLFLAATLLIAWSWTSGFLITFLSRRTLWVSAVLCLAPCLSCVLRFREPSISRICVLLFLAPGVLGVLQGKRSKCLHFSTVIVVAIITTVLMLAWSEMFIWNWALVIPSWFLVAIAGTIATKTEEHLTRW